MWAFSGVRWFSPPETSEDDETYLTKVLTRQCSFFGPYPDRYDEVAAPETMEVIEAIERSVAGRRASYQATLAHHFSKGTLSFLDKLMKLGPRDRASAQQLLRHEWLSDVVDQCQTNPRND